MNPEKFEGNEKERPIYEPIFIGGAEEWDRDIPLRQKRMDEIVNKIVGRGLGNLSEKGKNFATQKLMDLNKLAITHFSGRNFSADSLNVYLVFESEDGYQYVTSNPETIGHVDHSDETMKAADLILNAVAPELGLDIHDRFEEAKEKAAPLALKGLAFIDTWRINFATVLPGVYVEFTQFDEEIDPDREFSIKITGITERFGQ